MRKEARLAAKTRLHMPRLQRVELVDFSLYTQRQRISADFGSGVFCLAGANGLGKSTFLAALNFGLTGVVPPEKATFKSTGQYYSRALAYSRDYFEGRVSQRDRESAEVTLEFAVRNHRYKIRRNAFETEALRYLQVSNHDGAIVVEHDSAETDEHRQEAYRQSVIEDIGLSSFPQFVFLQHFLLTFDERRRTLFWDADSAEKVLYLAFGVDPDLAERADELRKISEAADSLARNAQYDATTARTRYNDLRIAAGAVDAAAPPPDAVDALTESQERRDAAAEALQRSVDHLADARLALAAASANELRARQEYEHQFSLRLARRTAPRNHPVISELLHSASCPICTNSGPNVVKSVEEAIERGQCPLCSSALGSEPEAGTFQQTARALQRADQALTDARSALEEARAKVERIERECDAIRADLKEAEQAVMELENEWGLDTLRQPPDVRFGLEELERRFKGTIDDALTRKQEHLRKRDQALSELKPMRKRLLETYSEAELEFVPLFQELATQFLGLPLDVTLGTAGSERVRLVLSVKSERRRSGNQLSESQRYFLDIALRMALVIHMSGEGSPAPLYIDTPEGSLDIAYESRAGAMFAAFAKQGHPLVMTANINTSQLLLRLAEVCGTELMTLVRMTDWTTLSDVQAAEESRIEDAYRAIEAALGSKSPGADVAAWVGKAHG